MTETARIASLIQPSALSLLTRRLMDVLSLEITNQKELAQNGNETETQKAIASFFCNGVLNLFSYKFQNFDLSELNAICVNPQRETVEAHSTVRSQTSATFNITLFGASTAEVSDHDVFVKLERMSGIIRSILESGQYLTLGLQPGTIGRTNVGGRQFYYPNGVENAEALNIVNIEYTIWYDEARLRAVPLKFLGDTLRADGRYTLISDYESKTTQIGG